MKNYSVLLLLTVLTVSSLHPNAAMAQEVKPDAASLQKLSKSDQDFMAKALQGGMAEVRLGKLANQLGARGDVREFGARMVADHGKAGAELAEIAREKGVTVPGQLSAENTEKFKHLSTLTGEQFDQAYIREMVKDHQKDVAEFEEAAKHLNDPDLKAFAKRTLPTLKSHLERITEIQNAKQ